MTIKATFKDYFRISTPTEEEVAGFKDFYSSPGNKKLLVKMEATHAALPLRNPRFYIPSRMADGVRTFRTGEKPTKILKHHDADSDPVGKVVGARFVPTVPEDLVNNMDVITLMSSSARIKDQLKAMRNLKRAGVLDRPDYRGLGYIELIAEISDPKTVQQIQDGLFDAVSTNFDSPGEVYCSICGQNIAKDGMCEHERGEEYYEDSRKEDGIKFEAQLIPGVHFYKEASLIVLEGDQLASIEIIDTKDKDNNKTVYMSKDSEEQFRSGHSTFKFTDSVEEDNMLINGKEVPLLDEEQKIFDQIKKFRNSLSEEEVSDLFIKVNKTLSNKRSISDKVESGIDEETSILFAIEDIETKDQKINADEICEEMRKELLAMKDAGELTEEEFVAADAKISTEKRKDLPKSVFCGPDRSFPVPDCAHVTAAKRLIGKYKGPGNKSSILACVSRKEKSLGCGGEKSEENKSKDAGEVSILPCGQQLDKLTTEELRTLWHKTELELIDRKQTLVRPCSDCAVKEKELEVAKKELGEARDSIKKSESILSVLRGELKRAYADYEEQVDEFVKLGTELHMAKAEKLAIISVLTKKHDNLEVAMDSIKNEDLDKVSQSIMDSFDIVAISDKLNDGMHNNNPKGTVKDPTVNIDKENKQLRTGLSAPAIEAIANIKDYLRQGKTSDARRIYATMYSLKMFPDEITLESLSAELEKNAD